MRKLFLLNTALLICLSVAPCCSAADSNSVRSGHVAVSEAQTQNSNWVIKEYGKELVLRASSTWSGWPCEKLTDGNPETSWFSAGRDSFAKGTDPWIEVSLSRSEKIKRITLLGNREPHWRYGYAVKIGKFEFFDRTGKLIESKLEEAANDVGDIDLVLKKPLLNVARIRFTSTGDEGAENPFGDIAIGEIQIE